MIKDLLRGVGIGCILAGGILYVTNEDPSATNPHDYKNQIDELQTELEKVKKELAVAQTLTSPKSANSVTEASSNSEGKTESKSDSVPTSTQITKIILSIEPGSTSSTVADKLERAGIIENAKDLEQYLIDKGLAGRIQIGEHAVDTTMDLETIARIITNTKNR
ncbi:endolytic transglycosylase MltG [Sporosarcina sp. ACRSL]|uniref:endolytic transglycosylase MltG n=1 Tax=Sporosarcina sp. ACRSL TaxID=2918215 RepID=UPI001EF4DBA8|nr:endolytic transglycosylase MltG [Sporosarcina sp. ACRSL]MCG7345131.1 endolytic transglycosylase MltG [Sporosarcina sp. ACRSL]